jgi:hypothetical protein
MADEAALPAGTAKPAEDGAQSGARSKDEVALELMKFIAVTTGYGKGSSGSAGFSGKPSGRTAEEHADSLLELFERCRNIVNRPAAGK